jgi:hypothetical protein
MPLLDQPVLAVEVGHDGFEQFGPFRQAFSQRLPFARGLDHRHRAQRPVTRALLLAIMADEDTGVAQILRAASKGAFPLRGA